ncbi:sphingosine N-acyltransferase lag1 [Podospora pseudocomata]|uniref:Sphingosine N-acyltransferase lag1 n=1 Tax=Podospora pseudocomata TaxID=2093779 RepID=A0ABR0GHR6_9PEZI|nr:sphingosine N-acyltransferase lag1 [Podospora pseudocomata]
MWHTLTRQTSALRRKHVHSPVHRHHRTLGDVSHASHPSLVLWHARNVRGLPAPHPRGRVQVLLPPPGRLLDAAGRGDGVGLGSSPQGFQPAHRTPRRHGGACGVELPISFCVYGYRGLHYSRHQRLFSFAIKIAKLRGEQGAGLVVWAVYRHVDLLAALHQLADLVLDAAWGVFSTVGPYVMDWEAGQYKSPLANVITFSLLALLQSLNMFWLYCLFRSAYKFVVLGVAKEDRSEAKDEGGDDTSVTVVGNNRPTQGLAHRKGGRPEYR